MACYLVKYRDNFTFHLNVHSHRGYIWGILRCKINVPITFGGLNYLVTEMANLHTRFKIMSIIIINIESNSYMITLQ
jgi:hypothetical protein